MAASTLAYAFTDGEMLGAPPVNYASTTQPAALGKILIATDPTYGDGEFILVKFTGTVAAGDFVFVDRYNKTAVQVATTATKGNLGISMAAQVTGQYGWVMIRGVYDVANVVTACAANALLGGAGVLGRANVSGTVANYTFDGALTKTIAASNQAVVELYWPSCSGR